MDSLLALLDSDSEVNIIHLAFVEKLGLIVWTTNVDTQKIDGTTLDIYGMVVPVFLVTD